MHMVFVMYRMAFRNSRGKRKRAVEEAFWYVNVFDFVCGLSFAVKVILAVKAFFLESRRN